MKSYLMIKVREVADIVGISFESDINIIDGYLNIFKEILNKFHNNPKDFLRRFVTIDEILVYQYTPETKHQSK